ERLRHRRGGGDDEPLLLPALAGAARATVVVIVAAANRHESGQRQCQGKNALHHCPLSTMTEVALTAAIAGTPGARPSSSTASRVTAAVMRCGPALISTMAITPSTS